jgi:Arc/MetJ-type ribon-helix-helix transcriptional regulator
MGKKIKTSIALEPVLLEWVDEIVKTKRFANRTHAVEYALKKLQESGVP